MNTQNRRITIPFKVSLDEHLPPNAAIAVTGSIEQLGCWNPHRCEVLQRYEKSIDGELWCRNLTVTPTNKCIYFRYAIVEVLNFNDEEDSRLVKILKWETHIQPRVFDLSELLLIEEPQTHTFGVYNGQKKVERGWLTGQHEIHLRVYGEAFKWFKPRHRNRRLFLRCYQVTLKRDQVYEDTLYDTTDARNSVAMSVDDEETRESGGGNQSTIMATYSALRNDPTVVPNISFMVPGAAEFRSGDFLIFRTQVLDLEAISLEFEVYVGGRQTQQSNESDPRLVGTIRMMPFEHLAGVKSFHIFGNNRRVIGQMTVDFLIINTLNQTVQLMDTTYCKHWTDYGVLKIGHRGAGSSYGEPDDKSKTSAVKENTLRSLRTAFDHGADYVEFDVHLSKDKIPVIYHDFKVVLTLKKKRKCDHSYMEVAVKDLTLEELQGLKVSPRGVLGAGHSNEVMTEEESDNLDTLAFCTLNQVFKHFNSQREGGGFNIEVKYPAFLQNGECEQDNYFERNESVDIILKEVFRSAGERRIIFSSFDPDVCTMLRIKQNKYPVLFLSQGITSKYMSYKDPRTHSLSMSVNHAVDIDLLGVCVFHEELLSNREIMPLIKAKNLVVFVWGSNIDDDDEQQRLKSMKVNGIIFDRIHEIHKQGTRSVFRGNIASIDNGMVDFDTTESTSQTRETNSLISLCSNNSSSKNTVGEIHGEPATKMARIE